MRKQLLSIKFKCVVCNKNSPCFLISQNGEGWIPTICPFSNYDKNQKANWILSEETYIWRLKE